MRKLFLIQLHWGIFVSKHFEIDLDDIYFETSRNGFYGIELILINSFCQKQPPWMFYKRLFLNILQYLNENT